MSKREPWGDGRAGRRAGMQGEAAELGGRGGSEGVGGWGAVGQPASSPVQTREGQGSAPAGALGGVSPPSEMKSWA